MYREQSNPFQRGWQRWLIAIGVLLICLVFWRLIPGKAVRETAKPEAAPPSFQGWRIELAGASENAAQFSGFYPPGKTLILPVNSDFVIVSQPEMRGELDESAISGSWKQHGGRIASSEPAASGSRQRMRAPRQPGLYRLIWTLTPSDGAAPKPANRAISTQPLPSLDVLVMSEAEIAVKGERTFVRVNGKSIGGYLDPLKSPSVHIREHADRYQVPRFFALLTPETARLRLGQDFELGNLIAFIDRTDKEGHKVFTTERHTDVLPVRMELIEKLLKLRERLQQKGVKISRFAITSAFRTPDYNKTVGGVAYSRHTYGDAVDLYIDENNDHHMDDLNGDGKLDRKDGMIIGNACRELELEGAVVPGGIGVYEWDGEESVRSHVHIDCRGYVSRWGTAGKRSFTWWPPAEFQGDGGD